MEHTVPKLFGQIERSQILRFWVPYTLSLRSSTPPSSRGFIAQVPSECHVVSTIIYFWAFPTQVVLCNIPWSAIQSSIAWSSSLVYLAAQLVVCSWSCRYLCSLNVFMDFIRVIWLRRLVPCSHVNTNSEPVRIDLLRRLNVNITASSGRTRVEVWVMGS